MICLALHYTVRQSSKLPENQELGSPKRALTDNNPNHPKGQNDLGAKSELQHNVPQQHSAENFPWLPKEQYFSYQHQYVEAMTPEYATFLRENPQFKYRGNPYILNTTAALMTRALFVEALLQEHQPDKSIPLKVWNSCDYGNPDIGAETLPIFELGDKSPTDITKVAESDMHKLKLKEIHIVFNINAVGDQVNKIDHLSEEIKQQGSQQSEVDSWQSKETKRLGILLEGAMVEEVSHAHYIMRAANDPESLKAHIEDMKRYVTPDRFADVRLTPEQAETHITSPIEQDADKWVEAFTRTYYPDVEI